MRSRNRAIVFAILALVASTLLVAPAAADHHVIRCDHEFVKVHGNHIKVLPSGGDDTANLQCALDLASSMPWAKVKLIAGEYHTGFLEAEGFHGVFKGAGRDHTTILTLAEGLDCASRLEEAGDAMLLMFEGGDVVLKGFTIGIGGEAPCAEPWDAFIDEEGFGYEDRSIGAIFTAPSIRPSDVCPSDIVDFRLRVYDVAVISEFPDLYAPVVQWNNFFSGVATGRTLAEVECWDSWLRGRFIVRNSVFDGIRFGAFTNHTHDSTVVFGGPKPWQGNTFDDVGMGAAVAATSDTQAFIKGNHIDNVYWFGVFLVGNEHNEGLTRNVVTGNHIVGIDVADGIGSLDFGPELGLDPLLQSKIAHNTIEVNTPFNGIVAIGADGEIIGNRISGDMQAGIFLDGIAYWDEETEEDVLNYSSNGWHIARNKLRGVEPFVADIFLNGSTDHNTVICNCAHDTVLDDGVDNIIVHCDVLPPEEPADTLQSVDRGITRTLKSMPYPQWRFEF